MIEIIIIAMAAIIAGGGAYFRGRSTGKKEAKNKIVRDQMDRENETNRRVADAQEANRVDSISQRRERMFGDARDRE